MPGKCQTVYVYVYAFWPDLHNSLFHYSKVYRLGEIQWKKSKISGNFEQKISRRSFFSFSFLSQSRPSRLHYTAFWVTTDQCKILNFSTKSWSVWTKNFRVVLKNGPPRAAGRKLCKMGAGRPEVILSAVKCLASSGAFEKFTKF